MFAELFCAYVVGWLELVLSLFFSFIRSLLPLPSPLDSPTTTTTVTDITTIRSGYCVWKRKSMRKASVWVCRHFVWFIAIQSREQSQGTFTINMNVCWCNITISCELSVYLFHKYTLSLCTSRTVKIQRDAVGYALFNAYYICCPFVVDVWNAKTGQLKSNINNNDGTNHDCKSVWCLCVWYGMVWWQWRKWKHHVDEAGAKNV